ncbi:MAG: TraR/DksA C4-type zinc finger protein [Bacillus sp. (in: firmicutes)]
MPTSKQIDKLKQELIHLKQTMQQKVPDHYHTDKESLTETVDELSSCDNHPADLATELYEREREQTLEEHSNNQLQKIEDALQAIREGTYGTCIECGEEIPYERLEIIPYSLHCVEHAPTDNRPEPNEEIVLPHENPYDKHKSPEINDEQDSFREVGRYGTSETPADFIKASDYDSLYTEKDNQEGFTEEIETFTGTDIDGKEPKIYPNNKEKDYKQELDDKQIESPLGDIPYKRQDSYIRNQKKK